MATAEPPAGPRPANLPATYQNPWGLLGQDLRAVVADLGLQLRALWRRNRAGELSVPGFWPGPLQALFWPLLLALLLALPWIGWRLLTQGQSQGPGSAAAPGPERPLAQVERLKPAQPQAPPTGSTKASLAVAAPPAADLGAAAPPAVSSPAIASPAVSPPTGATLAGEPVTATATTTPLALDPLLQLLAAADPGHWIVSAHPEPAQSLLHLTLGPAYAEQPLASRSQWVDRWCEKAQELGYERFELVDEQQRPLGRKALVGSGMILLDPVPRL